MANCSVMSSTKSNDSSNQSTLNVSNKIASNQVLLFSEEKKRKMIYDRHSNLQSFSVVFF